MASLSARRAWIEIGQHAANRHRLKVALRKESVDRNVDEIQTGRCQGRSLSARRAWIEIRPPDGRPCKRNRRSPQGERG